MDPILVRNLRRMNFDFSNQMEYMKITATESLTRVLDKPPKPIDLKIHLTGSTFSITDTIARYCEEILSSTGAADYCIELPNATRRLSASAYAVLKSLLFLCTHYDEALAKAASEMFISIASGGAGDIDDQSLYETIDSIKLSDYYKTSLVNGIKQAVFRDSDIVMHWRSVSACGGWYIHAIKAGEDYIKRNPELTVKALDKELSEAYKEAYKDKKWMSLLVRKVPTKPLIGMMWKLYKESPEVMVPSPASAFMSFDDLSGMSSRTADLQKVVNVYVHGVASRGDVVNIAPDCFDEIYSALEEFDSSCLCNVARGLSTNCKLNVSTEGGYYICKWNS